MRKLTQEVSPLRGLPAMKLFVSSVLLAGFLYAQPATPPGQAGGAQEGPKKPAIEGVVLQEGSGTPISKPSLTLARVDKPSLSPPRIEGAADGTFQFDDLEPGSYTVIAEKPGFAGRAYGGKNDGTSQGIPIKLAAGERRKIEIRLVKHGMITGRVLDADGEPVQSAYVMAMRKLYARGVAIWLPAGQPVQSNDLGEFRLSGLAANRYILCALPMTMFNLPGAASTTPAAKPGEKPAASVTTCYPNVTDRSQAAQLQLSDGMEMPNVDLRLARRTVVTVKGQIAGLPANAPQMLQLSLTPKGLGPGSLMWGNRTFPMASEGKFEFKNVQPGQYFIQTVPMNLGSATFGVKQSIEVGEDSIDGLQVPALTPFEVQARFTAAEGELPPLAGTRLIFTTADEVFNSVPMATLGDSPEFTVNAIFPDRYYINVLGLPEGVYIHHVKCGDRITDERQVEITSAAEPLEIVLGLDGSTVAGMITDDKGEPVRGAWVALLHDRKKVNHRTVRADEKGQFTIRGVVPGEYRAFAAETLDPGSVDDDEAMAPHLGRATRVKVDARSQASLSLKVK